MQAGHVETDATPGQASAAALLDCSDVLGLPSAGCAEIGAYSRGRATSLACAVQALRARRYAEEQVGQVGQVEQAGKVDQPGQAG